MHESTKLFQINENDTQWRRVQQIVMDVRWNYGPPSDVEVIPADQP